MEQQEEESLSQTVVQAQQTVQPIPPLVSSSPSQQQHPRLLNVNVNKPIGNNSNWIDTQFVVYWNNYFNYYKFKTIQQIAQYKQVNEQELMQRYLQNLYEWEAVLPLSNLTNQERCIARVYENGFGNRCSKKRVENVNGEMVEPVTEPIASMLCRFHLTHYQKYKKLKYGIAGVHSSSDPSLSPPGPVQGGHVQGGHLQGHGDQV